MTHFVFSLIDFSKSKSRNIKSDFVIREAVIVSELPDGYSYAGELTGQEKEFAYINGEKYYLLTGTESIEDFYVYQECGTPVSKQEIDNTKRQWAYVKWSLGQ